MADIEFGEAVGSEGVARPVDVSMIINGLGAVVSLALIVGLGWWGYQLLVRDVAGVPVVRALEGPMRIAPDDPGGASAEFQGLAVNNIPAKGEAEAPADRLVLAPKPTALTPEDQPAEVLSAMAAAETEVQSEKLAPSANESAPTNMPAQGGGQDVATAATGAAVAGPNANQPLDQAAIIEATLKSLAGTKTPDANASKSTADPAPASAAIAGILADIPGVTRSPLPIARPQKLVEVAKTTPVAAQIPVPDSDGVPAINPSEIAPGTRLVQIGAFDTPEIAKAEWLRVANRFQDFMTGKSRVIEKAQAGGKVFYRLRVHGFEGLSDARRFCSALLAGQAGCIPVVSR